MKVLLTLAVLLFSNLNLHAVEATHGMVIFGKEKVFAYHLPMFHKIHNKQVVIIFDLSKELQDQIVGFEESGFLTFVPDPFDLERFIAAPFDLHGDLYSGHFEKDGTVVMAGITLTHPKLLYVQELVKPGTPIKIENYKIIGSKTDAYALHLIDGGSSIDQLYKLTTLSAIDFESAKTYHNISSDKFLKLQTTYTVSGYSSDCPPRVCGVVSRKLATFNVDSLYFTDSVM